MSGGPYEVRLTDAAARMIRDLARRRRSAIEQLETLIGGLATNPLDQTRPLGGALKGLRSLHSGRFRAIVRIAARRVLVYVIAVGWHSSGEREDIYQAWRGC